VAPTAATIDEYIASFPDEVAGRLEQTRSTIRHMVPAAEESISYGIPTFSLDGRYLVYFAGWKRHISVYPVPAADPALEQEIAPYRAAKGTLRFPLDQPMPYDLVGRVVQRLVAQRADFGT
jgi:uncharacterized protein YdhG (YjbR/CyaY superfamily)